MFGLRMPELLVILLIVVLLFGANKLPQIGAGLGQSIRGFKKALDGHDEKEEPPASGSPGQQQPPQKP
ncbi:MAG TPA: twin-arginine translocase TatA/TatE family subunit [Anaeromyxobacter sp.]|nr:twin-arginine translocase TatA/TatE family subunit [Anaeromyxobacter sp.]